MFAESEKKEFDCVVCGLATVDLVARPVPLDQPIGRGRLLPAERIEATTGGLVSNSGIALARLGARTAALAYVGHDPWADLVRGRYQAAGIDTTHLVAHPSANTPATIVLVDAAGDRSFVFELGAVRHFNAEFCLSRLDLFARSHFMLFGYYALVPECDVQLPEIFARVRETGCRTALDSVGEGGGLQPLDRILPHCDVYVPSLHEARQQTGCDDPAAMIDCYRQLGAPGIVGLKLGARGALLSSRPGKMHWIEAVQPPGPVIDTTGAGDAFYAGLLVGLRRGLSCVDAGRLAAAAGACCVTGLGASAGLRDFATTRRLAGLAPAGDAIL